MKVRVGKVALEGRGCSGQTTQDLTDHREELRFCIGNTEEVIGGIRGGQFD